MSLEVTRSALEELHTIEKAITDRIQRNPEVSPDFLKDTNSVLQNKKKRTFRETLLQQHEIAKFINIYKRQRAVVEEMIQNKSSLNEIDDPVNDLEKFDELYQKIKSEDTDQIAKPLEESYAMKSGNGILSIIALDIDFNSLFSSEEYFGKYLDLISFHEQWLNLNVKKLSYVKYLEIFHQFDKQEFQKCNQKELNTYLKDLLEYLISFIKKALPLFNLNSYLEIIQSDFNSIKTQDPLYCEVCDKTFTKQTVFNSHLSGKKHLKNKQNKLIRFDVNDYKYKISKLTQIINKQRQDTRLNTERRKALTERERLIEIEQLEKQEHLSDSDDEQSDTNDAHGFDNGVYNPMNLPLDADGQPIPFWLWKLHGLGIEYNCEICGNTKYKGRKAFEAHFTDARHIHGLKCLGITPSPVFSDIIDIKQALELNNKLTKEKKERDGERENAVEVEDEEGNVMSEKVYNDLKKQGLI